MHDKPNLTAHFEHWDNLFRNWNSDAVRVHELLPEPWWGWTPITGEPLHSVCINLNPGKGGKLQTIDCVRCIMRTQPKTAYSQMMANGMLRNHLPATEAWHHRKRYRPIMKALGAEIAPLPATTLHHLSVELSPYHQTENLTAYLTGNAADIYKNVLLFAAKAACYIDSPYNYTGNISLAKTVVVRASLSHVKTICNLLKDKIIIDEENIDNCASYFHISDMPDVRFVCVNGFRNNLPASEKLRKYLTTNNQSKQ